MTNLGLFTLSPKNTDGEYSATIVRIGSLRPIEGSDFLAATEVCGEDVVVRKDEVKPGDVMVYCRIETVLDQDFLSCNNLFRNHTLNKNCEVVQKMKDEGDEAGVRANTGFFEDNRRVKIVRLRSYPSKGFLFGKDALMKWKPSLFADVNLEDYLDVPYWDTIAGKPFLVKYMPKIRRAGGSFGSSNEARSGFDRIIKFDFHYDTRQLTAEIGNITPKDSVSISVKLHGTSFIMGNIEARVPKQLSESDKAFNRLRKERYRSMVSELRTTRNYSRKLYISRHLQAALDDIRSEVAVKYADIYSSRTVIKNQYINLKKKKKEKTDIWGEYYERLKGRIPEDVVIYGEIFGYCTDSEKCVQQGYDYGCDPGKNKLMIYRVKIKDRELDVPEVHKWTLDFIKANPELKDVIHPIDILYNGTLSELFPDIPVDDEWNSKVLACLKTSFGLEQNEPMCKTKVPREGVVVRIDKDKDLRAFKLKAAAFLFRESKQMDKGEVSDLELEQQV